MNTFLSLGSNFKRRSMNQREPEFDTPAELISGKRLRHVASRVMFAVFVVLAAVSWEFWDNRDESQISKILSESPQLVRLAATDSEKFGNVEAWLRTLVYSDMSPWALDVSRMIGKADFRIRAMSSIVKALVIARKVDEAQRVAGGLLETTHKIEDPYRRSYAVASVVEALAMVGRADEALKTARGIGDANIRFGAIVCVVEALAKTGKREAAGQVAGEALETARAIGDMDLSSRAKAKVIET